MERILLSELVALNLFFAEDDPRLEELRIPCPAMTDELRRVIIKSLLYKPQRYLP